MRSVESRKGEEFREQQGGGEVCTLRAERVRRVESRKGEEFRKQKEGEV